MNDPIPNKPPRKSNFGCIPIPLPVASIVERYEAGESPGSIAKDFGVTGGTICRRIIKARGCLRTHGEANVISNRKGMIQLPIDKLVSLYSAGESVKSLSERFRVSRMTITARLRDRGTTIRGFTESAPLSAMRRTPESKAKGALAAHAARRGQRESWETKCLHAQIREQKPANVSQYEVQLAEYFTELGVDTIPQKAIGGYNCDFAAYPVAVEVFGGQWHWHGGHAARFAERTHYILNQGWFLYVIQCEDVGISLANAQNVAAYIQSARRYPSARRKYWVVRSTGQLLVTGSLKGDKLSAILTAGCTKCMARWADKYASR